MAFHSDPYRDTGPPAAPGFSRRAMLGGLAALPALALPGPARAAQQLRDAARPLGIHIGSAVDFRQDVDPAALDLMQRECTLLTPENAGKWKWAQPEDGAFIWAPMDETVDFAQRTGKALTWHTLIWQHNGMPEYMKLPEAQRPDSHPSYTPYYSSEGTLAADNYWQRFHTYIKGFAERYGDPFFRIDVVNEPFLPHGTWVPDEIIDAHGFRKGQWWHVAGGAEGPEWPDQFFAEARRLFPGAHLVLNETAIEARHSQMREKRAALLAWLEAAVQRGCPIDGVGVQSHLRAWEKYDVDGMAHFASRVTDLGLSIFITEMDVDTRKLPSHLSREERDRLAGEMAALHVETLLANGDLKEITWWGLTSNESYKARRLPEMELDPTLFDRNHEKLPMYDAVLHVLENAV